MHLAVIAGNPAARRSGERPGIDVDATAALAAHAHEAGIRRLIIAST